MTMATTEPPSSSSSQQQQQQQHSFEVFVSNDSFKFNAAHFVAYSGYRERLHGHNYRVSVRLRGSSHIGPDGYVLDFGCIKAVTRTICKELNEHFLCPTLSNVIKITTTTNTTNTNTTSGITNTTQVRLDCEDGSVFVFPQQDCAMLPLVHATTEELAIYLWGRLLEGLQPDYLRNRGVTNMQVTVSEAPQQEATFSRDIPDAAATTPTSCQSTMESPGSAPTTTDAEITGSNLSWSASSSSIVDVRNYIQRGSVIPMPCLDRSSTFNKESRKPCNCCSQVLSQSLQRLADAMNNNPEEQQQQQHAKPWTAQDFKLMIDQSNAESS